jgi:hypothetical protein
MTILITDLNEIATNISIYPNPTNGLLHIAGQGTMHITVSNLLGQKVMETTAESQATIDLSRHESGMYVVRIETKNEVLTQKVNLNK